MGWWFGRKGSPDARPFVPAWLRTGEEAGFALNCAGMSLHVVSNGQTAVFHGGAWEIGTIKGSEVVIDGLQVVGSRSTAITAPAGGATIDSQARTSIGQILVALRLHGLIEM